MNGVYRVSPVKHRTKTCDILETMRFQVKIVGKFLWLPINLTPVDIRADSLLQSIQDFISARFNIPIIGAPSTEVTNDIFAVLEDWFDQKVFGNFKVGPYKLEVFAQLVR